MYPIQQSDAFTVDFHLSMSDGEGEFFFYAGATAPTGCAHLCIHKGRSNGNPDVYWRNNLNNGAFVIFRPSDGEVALYYGGNRYHDDDTSNSGIYGDNAELDVTIKYNRNAKYEDDALTWQVYVDGNLVLNTYDSDNDWWAQNADIYWGFGAYNTDPNIEDDDGNLDPNTFALSYVKMVVSNVPGTVYTLAGRKSSGGYANGIGTNALFANPLGVAFDNDRDCLFISDTYNHVIRRINFNGYCADGDCVGDVLFVAGRGIPSPLYGLRDGSASVAKFHNPTGLAVGPDGNIVVCDFSSNVLRVINPDSGIVTTLAGSGVQGSLDGIGANAQFFSLWGIAIDQEGRIFVTDQGNHKVRRVNPGDEFFSTSSGTQKGWVTTHAGGGDPDGLPYGYSDGSGDVAKFSSPAGICLDTWDRLYVADFSNNVIRQIGYRYPTVNPTVSPTVVPTVNPTVTPTVDPTVTPTVDPTVTPTVTPTVNPTSRTSCGAQTITCESDDCHIKTCNLMYTNWNWYDGNFGHGEDDDFNQLSSGPCCSSWGECGSGVDFCGSGCQEAFSASFPGYYWEPMSACGQKETFFGPWIELQYPGVPGTPDHDVFEFEIYEASFSNGIFVSMCNCYSYYDDRDNRIQLLDKDDNELEYFIGGCWDDSCPQGGYVPQLYPDDDFEGFNTYKIKHICYPTYDWDGQTDAYCEGSTTVVIFEVMEIEEWYVGNAGESCYTVCNKVGKSCNGNWWVSWPKNCEDIYYIAANAVNGPIHCDRCRQGSDDDIYANPEIVYYGDQWGGNTHSDGSICFYRKYDTNRCDYYQEQSDDWWSHREAGYRFCPCWYYD